MSRSLLTLAALLVAAATGCDRMLMPAETCIYAPWEEGLTLGFENPSQPEAQREQSRFQVRVKESRVTEDGRVVVQTHTTVSGQSELTVLLRNGGESLGADGKSGLQVLPEGFPDQVSRWVARGSSFRVLGRAAVRFSGVALPEFPQSAPGELTGVWVESEPLNGEGPRSQSLYLPDIGLAETRVLENGAWKPVFRLTSRAFTDVPQPKKPKAGSAS